MATPATVNPFNHYVGLDGLPLDGGFLYFGEPFQDPQLVPLPAFWDDANTQPAAQPIRTVAGYPARNGAPAMVFVAAQYSMRVRDRSGRQVFYAQNVTAVDLGGGGLDVVTASGGQTIVTLTNAIYTPGSNAIDVYLNGLRLITGVDYFETGTGQITMSTALTAGDQIIAFARSTFGLTQAILSDWQAQMFDGAGGASQNFVLSRSPGSIANMDVSVTIGGIGSTLRPLLDYTLSGSTVTLTPAPAVATNNVLIRYGRSLPQDALRGELASAVNVSDGDALIGGKYATAAGSAALNLHDYVEDDGAYNIMGFISNSPGVKSAIRNKTSVVDVDVEMQAALTAAYNDGAKGLRFPAGLFNTGTEVALEMPGNRVTQGLMMQGAGINSTIIKQVGSQTSMLRFYGATPGGNATDVQLMLRDLSIYGVGKTADGITLEGIAGWTLKNVQTDACKYNLVLNSSLIGQIDGCILNAGLIGIITRQKPAAGQPNNTVTVTGNTQIKYNTEFGLDIGYAIQFICTAGVNIERNGTAANSATGGVIIRNTCDDVIGISMVHFDGLWLESNFGGYTIDQEAMGEFLLSVSRCQILTPEGGKAIIARGGRWVSLDRIFVPSGGDTVDLTCDFASVRDSFINVLTDTGVQYPTYENIKKASVDFISGKTGTFSATLTGCTTSPTGNITWTKQGKRVILNVPVITGTSNTTSATLTGMPVELRPLTARQMFAATVDNGVEKFSPITIGTSGVITLNNAFSGTFTNSGTKGTSSGWTIPYDI